MQCTQTTFSYLNIYFRKYRRPKSIEIRYYFMCNKNKLILKMQILKPFFYRLGWCILVKLKTKLKYILFSYFLAPYLNLSTHIYHFKLMRIINHDFEYTNYKFLCKLKIPKHYTFL